MHKVVSFNKNSVCRPYLRMKLFQFLKITIKVKYDTLVRFNDLNEAITSLMYMNFPIQRLSIY